MRQWYRAKISIESLNKETQVRRPIVRVSRDHLPVITKEIEINSNEEDVF